MKGGLVVALLLFAVVSPARAENARYTFGGTAEQGTFVLDTQSGRVWRYDRVDDAWYLYDLEALVRTPRGDAPARSQRNDTEPEPGEPKRRQE